MRYQLWFLFVFAIVDELCLTVFSFIKPHEVYYDLKTSSYFLVVDHTYYCSIANSLTVELLGYNTSFVSDIGDISSSDLIVSNSLSCPINFEFFHRHNCSLYKYYVIHKTKILNNNISIIQNVEKLGNYFNPSILPYQGKLLISQRKEPRLAFLGANNEINEKLSYQAKKPLNIGEVDIRMIRKPNGNVLLVFTNEESMKTKYSVYVAIRELSYNNLTGEHFLSDPLKLNLKWNSMQEKNWSPFIYGDEVYFIQSIIPLQIFKLSNKKPYKSLFVNRQVESVDVNEVSLERCTIKTYSSGASWEYGEFRGGTPAILIPKYGYLSFFHTNKNYLYCHHYYYFGAYLISSDKPFKLLKISNQPYINEELIYDARTGTRMISIVFPMSFYLEDSSGNIMIDGSTTTPETIVLTVGYNDTEARVVRMSFQNVISSMVDVCCV